MRKASIGWFSKRGILKAKSKSFSPIKLFITSLGCSLERNLKLQHSDCLCAEAVYWKIVIGWNEVTGEVVINLKVENLITAEVWEGPAHITTIIPYAALTNVGGTWIRNEAITGITIKETKRKNYYEQPCCALFVYLRESGFWSKWLHSWNIWDLI